MFRETILKYLLDGVLQDVNPNQWQNIFNNGVVGCKSSLGLHFNV